MPNTVRSGRFWLNLDFYVEAEEFGQAPAAPPGPGWIRIKMLYGHYHDIPAAESGELRRRLDALAGIEPPGAGADVGETGRQELPVRVRSAPVRPAPTIDDPAADQPQHGDAI
jgi:hypothetical protein